MVSSLFTLLQVKIWITSDNRTNFATTVVTENLACNNKDLVMYTAEDYDADENLINVGNGIHFIGKHRRMRLDSFSTENNKNLCVFRQVCEDNCYYVYLFVRNVPDDTSWKICEVLFD